MGERREGGRDLHAVDPAQYGPGTPPGPHDRVKESVRIFSASKKVCPPLRNSIYRFVEKGHNNPTGRFLGGGGGNHPPTTRSQTFVHDPPCRVCLPACLQASSLRAHSRIRVEPLLPPTCGQKPRDMFVLKKRMLRAECRGISAEYILLEASMSRCKTPRNFRGMNSC